ncbi:MAG: hypothetical protein JWN31_2064 [Frankiales bacterium]|nr:hypothetical protein [Frankiales bacterium]
MRTRRALLALVPLAALLAIPSQASASCPQPEKVSAFDAKGHVSSYRGMACTTGTGFLSSETHLRVAPDGTIVQQPAQTTQGILGTGFLPGAPGPRPQNQVTPGGFAISRDGGRSFRFALPADTQWVASDGAIHIDQATGRLYYYALSPATIPQHGTDLTSQLPAGYAQLVTSPDDGRTWHATTAPGYVESENPRFTSGVAPSGQDQPVKGESVAYWCGNTALFVYGERDCWRTLDGGYTWEERGTYLRRGGAVHSECGSSEEVFNASDGYYPSVGPDGTLWTVIECGGHWYLASSTDEAKSFPVVREIPRADEFRVDKLGHFYAVNRIGTKLLLRTSVDYGKTWSAAVDLVSPRVRGAALTQWWNIALRGPGQLAAAYLSEHKGGGYDASVTVLRGNRFVTATVYGGKKATIGSPMSAKDDYIDVDVAPDGTAWGTFFGDCITVAACKASSFQFEATQSVLLHVG